MARSEARISVAIWDDPDFVALGGDAQRMYLFLLSQQDLAHNGVIALRERRWSRAAAGLTPADVSGCLKELEHASYVVIDEDAEELLIRSLMRGDRVYRQPNVLLAARDHLPTVSSPAILAALRAELQRIATLPDLVHESAGKSPAPASIVEGMLEDIDRRLSKTSGAPSGNRPEEPPDDPPDDPAGNPSADPAGNPSGDPSRGAPGERGVVRRVSSDSPSPSPPSPDPSKTPPESSSRASSAKTKRGTRIPDDFQVTSAMVEWARENVPHVDGRRETEKFVNHWQAKTGRDATKLDWQATWRNWMLNAADRQGARASPPPQTSATPKPIPRDQQCPDHRGQPGGTRDDGQPRCGQCRAAQHGRRPA